MKNTMGIELSVIVTGRNDGYRDSDVSIKYLNRLQAFVDILKKELHRIKWELVFVEYNPPSDVPFLRDIINWKDVPLNHCLVTSDDWMKFIHKHKLNNAKLINEKNKIVPFKKFPVYLLHAMHEGLVNANGKWILYTSTDDMLCGLGPMVSGLNTQCVYRAKKVALNFSKYNSMDQITNNTQKILNKINARKKARKKARGNWARRKPRINILKGVGDFLLLTRKKCTEVGGYLPLCHPRPTGIDAQFLFFIALTGVKIKFLDFNFINLQIPYPKKTYIVSTKYNYVCKDFNLLKYMKNKNYLNFRKWALNIKHPRKGDWINYDYSHVKNVFDRIMEK